MLCKADTISDMPGAALNSPVLSRSDRSLPDIFVSLLANMATSEGGYVEVTETDSVQVGFGAWELSLGSV